MSVWQFLAVIPLDGLDRGGQVENIEKGEDKTAMATQDECDLGELICKRTRYKTMTMPPNWKNEIEWEGVRVLWYFRELPRRVAKAIRIPVIITVDKDGQTETYKDWLLIGYEGADGP